MPKYIASCSGGKDSIAMVMHLIVTKQPLDAVVFYDTGMEFKAVYGMLELLKTYLPDTCAFIHLKPEVSFDYYFSQKSIKKHSGQWQKGYGWCGGRCRWATKEKLKAINKFLLSLNDDYVQYIGIAADELERIKNDPGIVYPLVEAGWTEADCLNYCYKFGFRWEEPTIKTQRGVIALYDILDRVSCWCCANKNIKELRHIREYLPQYWERLLEYDKVSPYPFHGYYNGVPITIAYYDARFELDDAQISLFDEGVF